jgi:PAS domain S-box-containing protein
MKDYIKHNLQFYEYVIDNSNVFIDAFDKDGNVVLWNKAAEEITGYSKEEVMGKGMVLDWLYPDLESRGKVLSSIGTSFKQNYKNVEFTLTTKYGEKRTVSWSTIKVVNDKGQDLGSFGFGVDITLRKKSQKREREAFLALMKVMRDSEAKVKSCEELVEQLKKENQALKNKLEKKG